MKQISIIMLALVILVTASGCDVINERARLKVEEKREDNRTLQYQAMMAEARAEMEKNKWEGAAMFLGVLAVALQPIYGMTIAVVLGIVFGAPLFYRIAFPERYKDAE